MTVLTCVFGMLPLMTASGVGAHGNSTLGAGVVGGMIVGTLALLFLVPTLFIVFQTHTRDETVGRTTRRRDEVGRAGRPYDEEYVNENERKGSKRKLTTSKSKSNYVVITYSVRTRPPYLRYGPVGRTDLLT